jgi:predicted lipid-binding transport protein (Tim44 family)
MNLQPSTHARSRGIAATLLVLVIAALLAALTIVNIATVRRSRRETELLDARQQRQWRQRGYVVPSPRTAAAVPPAAATRTAPNP